MSYSNSRFEEGQNISVSSCEVKVNTQALKNSVCSTSWKFYFFIIAGAFMFGTKYLCIGISKLDKIWVFFIDHFAMLITTIILLLISRMRSDYDKEEADNVIMRKDFLIWSVIGGLWGSLGDLFIIYFLTAQWC